MDLITVTRDEGLKFKVRVRDHVFMTDMAMDEGGKDGGLAPVELPRDVPENDREKLKKMALRMPVPATLRGEPRVDIEML